MHNITMRLLTTFLASTLLSIPCLAQLPGTTPPKGVTGTFYVSVDDGAKIFINGQQVHDAGVNESRSGELELSVGQRIVVQLRDDGGGHRFMMAFVSSDRQTVISFRHRDFKIVPDLDATDFTPAEFLKWPKYAKDEKRKPLLPVKNYSEWMWGDVPKCILAGTITPEMIKPLPK